MSRKRQSSSSGPPGGGLGASAFILAWMQLGPKLLSWISELLAMGLGNEGLPKREGLAPNRTFLKTYICGREGKGQYET